jgi:tetratricopeptide (TPR) repeat protein
LSFIVITGIFFLAGIVALFAGGEIQTLFPANWSIMQGKSKNENDPKRDLFLLTKAVWQKNYKGGLKIARQIREKQLNHLDRLDYLFLRAYCTLTLSSDEDEQASTEERREMREQAIADLENVIEDAPKRGEALYLLGLAYGISNKNAEALEMFERSRESLKLDNLPFDHNESVCLLKLAEFSLSRGDTEQAENYFQRVTNLGKLADSVVESRIRIGMIDLQNAVNKKEMAIARTAIARLEELKGLKDEQQLQIEIVRVAFNARTALRDGDAGKTAAQLEAFLTKYLPKNLPKPDDEAADETLGSPIDDSGLPFPREVFRGLLFIYAVALSIIETRNKSMLSETQVEKLKEPLLRALQFSPRHRDLLGALGGIIYWFRKDKRQKAVEWLEAAATMGVSGRIVKKILEQDRLIEVERRQALDWFRSASSRLLRDPSLNEEVRTALIEELGRFQEFETLIVDLEEKPDFEPEEPTLDVIRERARYLLNLVTELSKQGQIERQARLQKISADYAAYLQALEHTTENINSLERRVFEELGDILEI